MLASEGVPETVSMEDIPWWNLGVEGFADVALDTTPPLYIRDGLRVLSVTAL